MAYDVFISHAREDKAAADQVCKALEDAGQRCWIAPRDIMPGVDWAEAIVDGIAQSHVLLLLLSSHSNDSQHVERELEKAVNENIPIVPVRIEDIEPSKAFSYYLGSHQWLDAFAELPDVYLRRLVAVVGRLVAGDEVPQPVEVARPIEQRPPIPTRFPRAPGRPGWVLAVVVAAIVSIVALVAVVIVVNQGSEREPVDEPPMGAEELQKDEQDRVRDVVVRTPQAGGCWLREEPVNTSPTVLDDPVPDGTQLRVTRESGDWYFVETPEGATGWVRWRYKDNVYLRAP